MAPTRVTAIAQSITALAAIAILSACSSASPTPASDAGVPAASAPPAAPAEPAAGASFCDDYSAAGGTLATPGLFQVAMPPEDTVADLSQRVEILEAVTPPDEIAAPWGELIDLYTETIEIAEETPADGAVAGTRVFEIVDELEAPGNAVSDYLDANC